MRAYEDAPPASAAPGKPAPERTSGSLLSRLVPPMPGSAFWGWAGPLLITVFGAILRLDRLGDPRGVVFDETYYVPDAYSILRHGVEINHVKNINPLLVRGSTHLFSSGGEYVAHPPLGKLLIAAGEWLFGLTPFGWRFAVAVVGSVAILMTARITRRMTRSTLLGCVAGLLVALDGLELVLSRTAILDIFVMFFALAAFGMLILDREAARARLARAAVALAAAPGDPAGARDRGDEGDVPDRGDEGDVPDRGDEGDVPDGGHGGDRPAGGADQAGPRLGIRWRRVLAGVLLGCAVAAKWNGFWYVIAFAGLTVAWDLGARRAAGFSDRLRGVLRSDIKWLPVTFGLVPFATYLATWTGWFATSQGYYRNWSALNGNHTPVWSTLDSWYQYNKSMLSFGLGLTSTHTYRSEPWTWLFAYKPVVFWYTAPHTCGLPSCSQEVLAIGTPAIWWASIPALLVCLGWWLTRRDWRAGAVLLAIAAGWLPWFWFAWHDHRTEFYFYAVVFLPYLAIALALCLGLIIGPAEASPVRRAVGAVIAGTFLLAVVADFAYLYPVFTARTLPYALWHQRMWFGGWIS
jgi:dolichyl-phosphate-mannose--protein O-mannosyl transferase